MHRLLITVSLTLGLAFFASELSAQIIEFNGKDAPMLDEMVPPASCGCNVGACGSGGACRGGQIIGGAGVGSGCGLGPCGPGGCPSGDCVGDCHFAPYGHCLYPSPCWGACKGPCCRTIFGEMFLDVRRWCRRPKKFGSLSCNAIGASDSGPNGVFCTDGGCGDLGCADENCCGVGCTGGNCEPGGLLNRGLLNRGLLNRGLLNRGLLNRGLLAGGLFPRLPLGGCTSVESTCGVESVESTCGVESVESCAPSEGCATVEAGCGCEVVGVDVCGGGCAGDAGVCFQDVLGPRRPQRFMGKLGDLLFGSKSGCGSCSDICVEADCGVEDISCGVEDISCGVESVGCAAVTPPPVRTQVAAAVENPSARSSAASKPRQDSTRTAPLAAQTRPVINSSDELPMSSEDETGSVRRVRFDEQVPPKALIRFRD